VFAAPTRQLVLRVTRGRPLDPLDSRHGRIASHLMLMRALFASFEREIAALRSTGTTGNVPARPTPVEPRAGSKTILHFAC